MEFLKEHLGDELYSIVREKLSKTDIKIANIGDGSYIPREKFNSLNEQVGDLKEQLKSRDEQLTSLKSVDAGKLQDEIDTLRASNKQTIKDYESRIVEKERGYAIGQALFKAGARNSKAVESLLNNDSIKYKDGEFEGLQEQIDSLKQSDSYLFDIPEPPATNPQGADAGQDASNFMNNVIRAGKQ